MTENLAPLRHRPFRLLAAGRTISALGNAIAPIALAFAVLDLTGSVATLGLVVGARSLTNVLFLLFGGVIADRLPRSVVLVGSSWCSAFAQAAIATLVLTHTASIPLLMTFSAINGISSAFALPASSALTAQTVPLPWMRQAVALLRLGTNTAMIAGASMAGVLIAFTSSGLGLAADAASFAIAGCCFALIKSGAAAAPATAPSFLAELRQGWTEFTARTWVWLSVAGFCFINAAISAGTNVLGPAVADASIGRGAWGFVLATQTAGLLIGALIGLRIRPQRPLLVGTAAMSATALIPLILAIQPHTLLLCIAALLSGIGLELFSIAWDVSLQQHIPPARLARVFSYDALGSFIAVPFAHITIGPFSQAVGTTAALITAAAITLTAITLMIASRSIRTLPSTTRTDDAVLA